MKRPRKVNAEQVAAADRAAISAFHDMTLKQAARLLSCGVRPQRMHWIPESVDDPVFGHLDWDEKLDWWVGAIEFAPGHYVDVFVNHAPEGQPSTEIAAARRILARAREREPEYRRWSADQLHAERWNTDEPMTSEDIANLLRVASLEFRSDGGLQIYWNDQDRLFWGNNVVTDVGPDGACLASGME